jgi:hypothetical protein
VYESHKQETNVKETTSAKKGNYIKTYYDKTTLKSKDEKERLPAKKNTMN